jgi:hypothetical protein
VLDPTTNAPQAASLLRGIVGTGWNIPESLAVKIFDLAEKMVTSAGKLITTNCYDYSTASGFTSAFDAVLTSITKNKARSSKDVYSALDKINSCQFMGMVCGQSPFTYNGYSIDQKVGIVSAQTTQSYGSGFSVTGGSSACMRYVSSEIAGDSILDLKVAETSGVVGIDRSRIGSLSLINADTKIAITNPDLLWTATLDSSFIVDNYPLSYDSRAATISTGFTSITPVDYNLQSVNADEFTFSLASTGKFVVYVQLASNASEESIIQGNSNISTSQQGMDLEVSLRTLAIAAAGSAVIIVLLGLVLYFVIKKRRRSTERKERFREMEESEEYKFPLPVDIQFEKLK